MRSRWNRQGLGLLLALGSAWLWGQSSAPAPAYDPELARRLGANDIGMRSYVLVLLKTGPVRVPDGEERKRMFEGHFANIRRMAEAGKLVLAGPLDGVNGWRGLFVLAVPGFEEARKLVDQDPVLAKGEMVAEYHTFFSSAALMNLNDIHNRLVKPAAR